MGFGGAGAAIQLERARGVHPDIAVDGVRSVLRILILFALVTPFWSLFDQKASTWILQANEMSKPDWFEPAMMQALNPLLVMLLIPFNHMVLVSAVGTLWCAYYRIAPYGRWYCLCGLKLDCNWFSTTGDGRWHCDVYCLAGVALCTLNLW